MTLATAEPISPHDVTIPLGYRSAQDETKRPFSMYVTGILSIFIGLVGVVAYLVIQIFLYLGGPDRPSESTSLDGFYNIEFYLCWIAMAWLLAAGIQVFMSKSRGPLSPYRMLAIYVAAKSMLTAFYIVLILMSHINYFAGKPSSYNLWNGVISWLIFMSAYPLFLAFVLRCNSVRKYYQGNSSS